MRRFRQLAWRTLNVVVGVLILGVLAFFGLTRTEVGREALRKQAVHQFNERFAGQLQIDSLSGNLVGSLTARGVHLRDPSGRLLAAIDSVTAAPHWSALLQRRLDIRHLTLHSPTVNLHRDAQGAWNVAQAFQRKRSDSGKEDSRKRIHISTLEVEIRNGAVTTHNAGPRPRLVAQGKLFNYADAWLQQLRATLHLDGSGSELKFRLPHFSARLTDPDFELKEFTAKGVLRNGRLQIDHFQINTAHSQIAGKGFANRLLAGSAARPGSLSVHVQADPLDFDEGRRLAPALSPQGKVQFSASAHGTLNDLTLKRFHLQRGRSQLNASGRVRGLPGEAQFTLSVNNSTLTPQDVASLLPTLEASQLQRVGKTRFSLTLNGKAEPARSNGALRANVELSAHTENGSVQGSGRVERKTGQPLSYEADVQSRGIDLERLTGSSLLSGSSGEATASVQGRLGKGLDSLSVSFRNTRLRALGSDALDLNVEAQSGKIRGVARLRQAHGYLRAQFRIDSTGVVPRYRLRATAREANLGPFLPYSDSIATRLNGKIQVHGTGTGWSSARGRAHLTMDSSQVQYGQQTKNVPGFQQTLRLAPADNATSHLELSGTLMEASLDASLSPALGRLGAAWLQKTRRAAHRAYAKPYHTSSSDTLAAIQQDADRSRSDSLLKRVRGHVQLKRSAALSALLPPRAPALPTDLNTNFLVAMRPDSLYLKMRASAEAFHYKSLTVAGPRLHVSATSGRPAALRRSLRANVKFSADTLHLGTQAVQAVHFALQHRDGSSRFHLTSGPPDQPGPLRLTARLDQLPDRNRLTVQELRLAAPGYAWTHAHSAPIDLYADAVVVPDLTLRNAASANQQRLALRGKLSDVPTDTLFLEAQKISLDDLSDWVIPGKQLGGRLNGRVAFTGGRSQPQLSGQLGVQALSFDDRLLGDLSVQSRYVQRKSDIAVQVGLRPVDNLAPPFPTDSTTASGMHIEPSRLQIGGTLRLPSQEASGRLNLNLDVARADFFFLEYIFDHKITDVYGAIRGRGHITGTFRDPSFQADLRLNDGAFSIPRFQTHYEANGPLKVRGSSIHLADVQLKDPTGGTATVNGDLHLNDYEYLSFDLRGALDKFRVVNVEDSEELPFYGRIWGSGRFALHGPLSGATLDAPQAVIAPKSEIYIPVDETKADADAGFIVFADSTGHIPDLRERRENIFADRPTGERKFTDGLSLNLNLTAQSGTGVHLVIDPLLGDQIDAEGRGRIQLQRIGGELITYGSLEVSSGEYLFTAGELFFRRFRIQEGGALRWTGPPTNPQIDLTASYRTRASTSGLPDNLTTSLPAYLPLSILVDVNGRVQTPQVQLDLALDRSAHDRDARYQGLETYLNRSDRSTEYATSVLLTNSFLLNSSLASQNSSTNLASTRRQLAFNSVSQLVASQLNRYLSNALPNFDLKLGLQGQNAKDLGVTYGLALHLLDERLIIRGEGAYQNDRTPRRARGLQGKFVVELRLGSNVSAEAFYRREGDLLGADLTNTTGLGLSYEAIFETWNALARRFLGWIGAVDDEKKGQKESSSSSPPVSWAPSDE